MTFFSNELIFNLQQSSTISYFGIDIGVVTMSFRWHESNSANVFIYIFWFQEKESVSREREKEIEENILSTVTALAHRFCLHESSMMHVTQRQNKKHT